MLYVLGGKQIDAIYLPVYIWKGQKYSHLCTLKRFFWFFITMEDNLFSSELNNQFQQGLVLTVSAAPAFIAPHVTERKWDCLDFWWGTVPGIIWE